MALTKAQNVFQDWNAVAQNTIEESAERDISGAYVAGLTIQAGLDTTTAHTGTKFIVQVNFNGSDDEDWVDWAEFVDLIGTALTEPIADNPLAAGSGACAAADTAGFETYGDGIDEIPGWLLIENGTLANSELVYQIAFVTDTSITWAGVTKNAHVQNTLLYNIAISKYVSLPMEANRVRVIVNNTYDADGSTLNYRVLTGEVTGV
jgi:hypothetical protein